MNEKDREKLMNPEDDFADETAIEYEINGRKFGIRLMLGEEFDQASSEFITIKSDETAKIDVAKRNSVFLQKCVVNAPYQKDGKPFIELNENQRLELLQKLKPGLRNALIKKVHGLHELDSDVEKN